MYDITWLHKKNYNKIFYNFPTVSHIALYPTNVHYYWPTPNEKFLFPLHVWGPREVKKHATETHHTISTQTLVYIGR